MNWWNNALYFMLKAHFVLEMLTFLSWLFSFVEKLLDKAKINFKIYGATTYNAHIAQYFKN